MFFNMMGNAVVEATLTVYVGNEPIQRQQIAMPAQMLQIQFMQIMQDIANQKGRQPMSVCLERQEQIWDPIEQKMKVLPLYIKFFNYEVKE